MKMIKTFVLLLTLLAGIIVSAQTNVGGVIATDVTWTKSNSPYHVTSDIAVLAKLIIDSGVVVCFDPGLKLRITAAGNLVVNGTISDTVIFKPCGDGGNWDKIFLDNVDSTSYIKYAKVQGANYGLNILNSNAYLRHTQISGCNYGIYADGTGNYSTIDSCLVSQNIYGFRGFGYSWLYDHPTKIINSMIINNSNGLYGEDGILWVENCIVATNKNYGIRVDYSSTISNNIIRNNGIGLLSEFSYNQILHNHFEHDSIGIIVAAYPKRTIIHCNSFNNNTAYNLFYIGGYDDGVVDASFNYFGSDNADTISVHIYDIYDNINLSGYFNFQHFLTTDTVDCDALMTSVSNISDAKPVLIFYPNPATNQLIIETNGTEVEQVNIYNTNGSLVMAASSIINHQLSIENLAAGVYIAEIKTKEGSVRKRWVKM